MADYGPGLGGAGNVETGPRASFWLRLAAALIDGVLLGVIGSIVRPILGDALGAAVNILLGLAYYAYLEGSPSGQTVGKRAMSIRVIDFSGGGPIGPGRALIRYLSRILSAIPCGLGYFWMLWDKEKQTWHDKLATTVVVPTSAYPVAAWPG
jgi:uncharacterized RDD family membrane protein YckC